MSYRLIAYFKISLTSYCSFRYRGTIKPITRLSGTLSPMGRGKSSVMLRRSRNIAWLGSFKTSPYPAWLFAFNGSAQPCTSASMFALSSQSASPNLGEEKDSSLRSEWPKLLSSRPHGESGFADGRSATSPDSEQMEQTVTVLLLRNSVSVEQIQDRE